MSQPDTSSLDGSDPGFFPARWFLLSPFTNRPALVLVAFEAFLTSLPFADAIPDYAEELQQRQLDSYFQMISC